MAQHELKATDEDLLEALQAMLPKEGTGALLRTAELAERLKRSPSTVRKLLHELRGQGCLIEGEVTLEKGVGLGRREFTVPAYGLKKAEEREGEVETTK